MKKAPVFLLIFFSALVFTADWPQFRGSYQNVLALETVLLPKMTKEVPKLLWSVENLGSGYRSIAVDEGLAYVIGGGKGSETLFAFDL